MLTMWAKYAIYEGIDNIAGICCIWAHLSKWIYMSPCARHYDALRTCLVPLHRYINLYITIVYADQFIVNILHFTPQYSTLKGIGSPYKGDKWEGDIRISD